MDIGDLKVTVPFARLVAIARLAGGQDVDLCPPHNTSCWRFRGLTPYLQVDPDDPNATECTECFLHYLIRGE